MPNTWAGGCCACYTSEVVFNMFLFSFQPEVVQSEKGLLTVTLHDSQELDDDLGARSDEDLALAGLLGVVHGVERIVENGSLDHFDGCVRFSDRATRK